MPSLPYLAALLVLAACGRAPHAIARQETAAGAMPLGRHEVMVFAAASLRAPFERLARAYGELHPGGTVHLEVAGSPTLVHRIEQGAPCDVLATANLPTMARAAAAGLLAPGSGAVFARTRLAIAVPRGNPKGVHGLADLGRADVALVLCAPQVPAGRYALETLHRAGVAARARSEESSVQGVLAKLRLGEADAGIVYATDVGAADAGVESVAIPREISSNAEYPIAVARLARRPDAARAFVELVLGARGQAIFAETGFERRE